MFKIAPPFRSCMAALCSNALLDDTPNEAAAQARPARALSEAAAIVCLARLGPGRSCLSFLPPQWPRRSAAERSCERAPRHRTEKQRLPKMRRMPADVPTLPKLMGRAAQ